MGGLEYAEEVGQMLKGDRREKTEDFSEGLLIVESIMRWRFFLSLTLTFFREAMVSSSTWDLHAHVVRSNEGN